MSLSTSHESPAGRPDAAAHLRAMAELVERHLDRFLPPAEQPPQAIHQAMRYSVFAGGKRLRPALALTVGQALAGPEERLIHLACALEMIHTFSLVHDDLPAMDDDDVRRGKPTSHKRFGEALAILAGDALLNLALQTLSAAPCENDSQSLVVLRAIEKVCRATGSVGGMIGGQVADIQSEGKPFDAETLDYIHRSKTGALIAASVESAALLCGAGQADLGRLGAYGRNIGLAFQIVDDLLDLEESGSRLGKTPGKDAAASKATYPALYGVRESRRKARQLVEEAIGELDFLGERNAMLAELARFISVRRF